MVKEGIEREVGVPEGWEVKTLGELGSVHSGGTPPTGNEKYWNGNISWLTPSEVTKAKGKYIFDTDRKITSAGLSHTTLLPKDCLIVCTRATIGNCCINAVPMAINQGFKCIQVNSQVDVVFIYYAVQPLKNVLIKLSCGNTFGEVSKRDFSSIKILFPPLREQKAIVDVLSTWDEAIEITEQLIKAKEKQFRWLLRTLIGDQCKKSGWKKVKLGEIGTFSKGYGITKTELTNSGLPCVRYGDIYTQHNFTIKNFSSFIDRKTAERSVRINPNDLLFAGSGETADEIGKCVAFNMDTEAYAGGDVIILRITTKDNADYVSYFLNTVGRRQLNKLGAGNSIVHIYSRDLQHVRIDVPPPSEQKAMIKIFQSAEKEIELLEKIVSQYRIQKRGLMQKLLTGKWRVGGVARTG